MASIHATSLSRLLYDVHECGERSAQLAPISTVAASHFNDSREWSEANGQALCASAESRTD